MAVIVELTSGYGLAQEFERYGRGDLFSLEAFDAMFNYLDELGCNMHQDIHVDIIELCLSFSEYDNLKDLYNNYSYSYDNSEPDFENINKDDFLNWVSSKTCVIKLSNGGYLIKSFKREKVSDTTLFKTHVADF